MKKRWILLFALLCVFLSSCTPKPVQTGAKLEIYYLSADGGLESGSAIGKEECLTAEGGDLLHEALRLVAEQPASDDLCSAFPAGVRISTYALENGHISVTLTDGYSDLQPIERSMIRACLVLTLCGLEEVQSVNLYEEENLLESGLTPELYLSESLPEGENQTEMRFWYPDTETGGLRSSTRTVNLHSNVSMTETILRQLLSELQPYGAPKDLQVLSASRTEAVCTVDLSAEFRELADLETVTQRLLIFSIVNTLTELDTVDSVIFRCEGVPIRTCGTMNLNSAFHREESFSAELMEEADHTALTLYLLAADGTLVPVRTACPADRGDQNPAAYAIRTLLQLDRNWGYQFPYVQGLELLGCTVREGVAQLVLTDAFWNGNDALRELTAQALAATAEDSGQVHGIRIMTEAGAYRNREILRKIGVSEEHG